MTPQLFPLPHTQKDTMRPKTLLQLDTKLQEASRKTMERHWLELVEYLSLGASAVGTLAVAVSGQAFYGVAPLTLALSLNVANRYRLEQQVQVSQTIEIAELQRSIDKMEKTTVAIILKLRQQMSSEIDTVRQQVTTLLRTESSSFDSIDVGEQLVSLGHSVASLQEIVASAVMEVRTQINEQLQALSLPSANDLEIIQHAIRQLQDAIDRLDETTLTQDNLVAINAQLLGLQDAIEFLQDRQESINQSPPDWSQIQTQIADLEHETQNVVKPSLKRLISVVKQLKQTAE
jgi:hypothetical protein